MDILKADAGSAKVESHKIDDFKDIVVHTPHVHLQGRIEASDNLVAAELFRGTEDKGTRLAGFRPNIANEIAVNEELHLVPGRQLFRLAASTAHSDRAERRLTIDYRPPVPEVELMPPNGGISITGEKASFPLTLEGKIRLPPESQPYRLKLLHNNRELTNALTVSEPTESIKAIIELTPGDNRIRVVAENKWDMRSASQEILVHYSRPPRLRKTELHQVPGRPAFNLEAEVQTATPIKEDSIRIECNSQTCT